MVANHDNLSKIFDLKARSSNTLYTYPISSYTLPAVMFGVSDFWLETS